MLKKPKNKKKLTREGNGSYKSENTHRNNKENTK